MEENIVTIIGIVENTNKTTGEIFYSLILSGKPEAVVSANGVMRIETPSVRLTTPMTKQQAEFCIGQTMRGRIVKTKVEPYEFVNSKGETVTTDIRRVFVPDGAKAVTAKPVVANAESELVG